MNARRWWLAGLAVVVLVVIGAAVLASPAPDGLERVAIDAGFADQADEASHGLLPGYGVPGLDDENLSTILAGVVGVALLFGAMVLLGRVLSRRSRSRGRTTG